MGKFLYFLKNIFKLPSLEEAVYALRKMKLWEKACFLIIAAVFLVSFFMTLWKVSAIFTVDTPAVGGTLIEGIIGTPRFINPVLAISDADRDMTALVYSGLLRPDGKGKLTNDLAEKMTISEDGLTYTFTLRPDLLWPDKKPITADDVLFTVGKIKDPAMKSPKRAGWEGVEAEKADERTVKFVLKKPYSPFLENATIGILPGHIWAGMSPEQMASSEMNINPIGSGPYQISKIRRNSLGVLTSYELTANKRFSLGKPNIKEIILKFYSSEKDLIAAYQKGEIASAGAVTPQMIDKIMKKENIVKALNLSRNFGVFFNQNSAKILTKKDVRQALDMAVDRKKIISDVLMGYGAELRNPLPPGVFGALEPETASSSDNSLEEARTLLAENGWKMNEKDNVLEKKFGKETLALAFTVSTVDVPELKEAAEIIKYSWERLGAKIDLKIFEAGDFTENVIRPRKYDALLFGQAIRREPDPFAFWHSSQRNDPGLNVALYANIKTDKLLEEARTAHDETIRKGKYEEFQKELAKDVPAVFLFSPKFIYVMPKELGGIDDTLSITIPSERFSTVYDWHMGTNKVWKIFAGDEQ